MNNLPQEILNEIFLFVNMSPNDFIILASISLRIREVVYSYCLPYIFSNMTHVSIQELRNIPRTFESIKLATLIQNGAFSHQTVLTKSYQGISVACPVISGISVKMHFFKNIESEYENIMRKYYSRSITIKNPIENERIITCTNFKTKKISVIREHDEYIEIISKDIPFSSCSLCILVTQMNAVKTKNKYLRENDIHLLLDLLSELFP